MTDGPIVAALHDAAAGNGLPDLSIAYSDLHGLWGGVAVRITGDGVYERVTRQRGGEPVVVRGRAGPDAVQGIARLLLEIEAWEQRVPEAATAIAVEVQHRALEVAGRQRTGLVAARCHAPHDAGESDLVLRHAAPSAGFCWPRASARPRRRAGVRLCYPC